MKIDQTVMQFRIELAMDTIKSLIKNIALKIYQLSHPKDFPSGIDLAYDLKKILRGKSLKTVFDVGANVGQTAIYFNKNFSGAEIYCFEPVKNTFDDLQTNVRNLSQVHTFNFGLGEKSDTLSIYINPEKSQISSLVNNANAVTTELVEIRTIDQFCQDNNIVDIDILKTDTEGYDLEVLKGAIEQLKNRKIKFVLSEVTFIPSDIYHSQFKAIFEYLDAEGFRFYGLYETNYHHGHHRGIMYSNALFVNPKLLKEFIKA
jgi:FkbM family methyltransferase